MKDTDTQAIPHAAPDLSSRIPEPRSLVIHPQAMSDNKILIVAARPELRQLLAEILQEAGYTVLVAGNERTALTMLATQTMDLVLLDGMRSDLDAVATLTALRQQSPVPVILFSAEYSATLCAPHNPWAIAGHLPKPFHLQPLLNTVQLVLLGHSLAP
jgi:DNA-binding response OmpR family regulator